MAAPDTGLVHASCVACDGRGLLILGPSGSGKSSLALALMALGCRLVSDDQTRLRAEDGALWAEAPERLRGMIEARGVGILAAEPLGRAPLVLAVDLDQRETARLPEQRTWDFFGISLPCLHRVEGAHFASAILQYLKAGRIG